jgi:hypothetical protein
VPHDWKRNDQQADIDFLRGASHMAAALCHPEINPMTANRWVNYLRGRAAAGKPVPPFMWFIGHVGLDRTPEDVYADWLAMEATDAQ